MVRPGQGVPPRRHPCRGRDTADKEDLMRMPHLSLSASTLLDAYGLYHITQLQADPELPDLAEAFHQAQERLRARHEEHRQAQAASLVATAVRDRKDMALDEAVLRFNHAVLEVVRKDRKAPLYVK
jgi:PAS domain-containing protein